MISRTSSPEYINEFIINSLEKYISNTKSRKKLGKIYFVVKDRILGNVVFKKEKDNDYIYICFTNCRYGYDFYNHDIILKNKNECCVCYDDTAHTIQCGHIICETCVKKIMEHSKTLKCPLCRKNNESYNGLEINYPMHLVTLLFNLE